MQHKLSNVLLKIDDHMTDYPSVYYRADDASYCSEAEALEFSGKVDFLTYFNACSVAKWRKYAGIQQVYLHLELEGDVCSIQFTGASSHDKSPVVLAPGQRVVGNAVNLELPATDKDIAGFELRTVGKAAVKVAYYFAEVEPETVNEVCLALATTTFKKEEYIQPNIQLIKDEVLASDDPVAGHFHMFVVDNGQTLDAAALSGQGVSVLPNKNVGGAGGFARGMMEALASSQEFTHVLLMDDDVRVSPESFKRTYNLLALAKAEYRNAFINGAMLALQEQNLQFEDVSYVLDSGAYRRIKDDLYIDQLEDVAKNESVDVEVKSAYGAWWFSCIPLSAVREKGLPLPVFVRCDDVEYGMRCNPTYMTMNGICVWHEAFEGRWRPSVDCYQYVRNFLIMIASDDCASEKWFISRLNRNIRLHMRTMEYGTVELFLDGLEDYLKGPDYLATVSGEQLMKENGAKNEKMVPVEELPAEYQNLKVNPRALGGKSHVGQFLRLWRTLPYDRHQLPSSLLRDKPEGVFYSGLSVLSPKSMGTKTLVAFDMEGKNATVRHMDRARYEQLMARWTELKKRYAAEHESVRAAYKDAKPKLTSWDFWNEYLGTDLHPAE